MTSINVYSLAYVSVIVFSTQESTADLLPRIYTYRLPNCSFDHFSESEVDGPRYPFHTGRPPLLPIHRRIATGRYATSDPANATVFYIPAPFYFWDQSHEAPLQWEQLFSIRSLVFNRTSSSISLPGMQPVLGNRPRSISAWIRMFSVVEQTSSGVLVLVAMGLASLGGSFILGVRDGCPIVSACGVEHVSACNSTVVDGTWHHVVATYDGQVSTIYVDAVRIDTQLMQVNTSLGPTLFGGVDNATCMLSQRFEGEVWRLSLYNRSLTALAVKELMAFENFEGSVRSHCFKLIRRTIEASPWFQRVRGWDHFVLFAGADYPSKFDPEYEPAETDFVFEDAWPAFANFSVLHFGARTERCFSDFVDPKDNDLLEMISGSRPSCVRRFFRTITIPPFLPNEQFDCNKMSSHFNVNRQYRIGYRGLAYIHTPERGYMKWAALAPDIQVFQQSGQIRLEFTNWTHQRVLGGFCTEHSAFSGLCSWRQIGSAPDRLAGQYASRYVASMKRRALEIWRDSETCLVMPGDGGYELRLFSAMRLGCIPVIITSRGKSLPKLPFVHALPWHEFSIFWYLEEDVASAFVPPGEYEDFPYSAHQLLHQLLHLDKKVILEKRAAILRYAHYFSWDDQRGTHPRCGGVKGRLDNALDLLVQELSMRSHLPLHPRDMIEFWPWKVPFESMRASTVEDLTGNTCPAGYPHCEMHDDDPSHGHVCKAFSDWYGWKCPIVCVTTSDRKAPYCVQEKDGKHIACHPKKCILPIQRITPAYDDNGFRRAPRLAIVSPLEGSSLTSIPRSNLERFCAEHAGRYDLLLESQILDARDWHPSWNKIALVKRALILGNYDAVIWMDSDVLVRDPKVDTIYDAIVKKLLALDVSALVLASRANRVPFDTGILVFRKGQNTIRLIERLFQIGRQRQVLDGVWQIPRIQGRFEQDAFAIYMQRYGSDDFGTLEQEETHPQVLSNSSVWRPGVFAAHFARLSNPTSIKA